MLEKYLNMYKGTAIQAPIANGLKCCMATENVNCWGDECDCNSHCDCNCDCESDD